ncbi:MAG: aminoacetone oxidase family FAD-binding enzyme [Phycisphaeraceae bacterium]|nr:MAG: aminoacetone oxidase family FAD-binding enzyme [Phycisphaeraceae bacterium]
MAAIWAGRAAPDRHPSITVLDGARSLGAKILVAGGGRCNVTHHHVDETAYAGSTRPAIGKVLRRFDADRTVEFFRELGVELKREETGKLFPTTDRARTVLDALLNAARDAGAEIQYPRRVERIEQTNDAGFIVHGPEGEWGSLRADRVIIATGGKSLPKTGSDGAGYAIVRALGHTVTQRITAALAPLVVEKDSFIRDLSGLTLNATLEVRTGNGKRLVSFTNSTLCTHFGLSGPAPMDISRYLAHARLDDPGAHLVINWLPHETPESAEAALLGPAGSAPLKWLREHASERLARALCAQAKIDPSAPAGLTREQRRALVTAATEMPIPVTGDRGWTHAEATAGGVPLRELRLETMESRITPGLFICGEICDVDGRIGGFNFQWAWASGFVAGNAAGALIGSCQL